MIRRALLALTLLIGPAVVLAPSAQAADGPKGTLTSVVQNTSTHRVTVHGYAYDTRSPSSSIGVRFYVGQKYAGRASATAASTTFNTSRSITGKHAFSASFTWPTTAKSVTLVSIRSGRWYTLGAHSATHVQTSRTDQIIAIAKRYVGKVPYRAGGASPSRGFDCSGYTQYVFAAARAGNLPHNADGQRTMSRMHRVSPGSARPGDLVFYQSGGYSFHVAIYAGKHMQYSAATVRDGIRYQPIWSSNVVYGRYI